MIPPTFRLLIDQFLRFAGVGAMGTGVQYLVLIGLVQFVGINATVASCVGYASGAVVNYSLNYRFTFNSGRNHRDAIWRYVLLVASGFTLNGLLMFGAVELLKTHYLPAQLATTGLLLLFNFLVSRWWVFGTAGVNRGI